MQVLILYTMPKKQVSCTHKGDSTQWLCKSDESGIVPCIHLSQCMRFPPMWYVHPAQPHISLPAGPRSAVGNVSGYRSVSDCRSRGREFDPGPVPYFCGD